MNKSIISVVIFIFIYHNHFFSQNVNYEIKISELKAKGDNNDGGGFFGSQDPTWFIWLMDNGTTASSLLNWQATGCIHTSNFYDVWWSGNTTNGPNIPHNWLTVYNTDATMIMTEMEGWEDDCGSGCDYNPNPSFWSSCFSIGDDNKDNRANSGNIGFLMDPPCTWNQYEINTGDYYARIQIYWDYVTPINPGIISGNQTICPGGDPSLFSSTANASPFHSSFSYQWQEDPGCIGTFSDIIGANQNTYDPPPGLLQTTCFRRVLNSSCGTLFSDTITVNVGSGSTNASSITTSIGSICLGQSSTLEAIGGSLGNNANYYWYENGCGLGAPVDSGSIITVSPSTTTTYFVRIESPCFSGPCVNITVDVLQPSTPPSGIITATTTVCPGQSINLSVQGGTLGSNASWKWYSGACGGVSIGNTSIITTSPNVTTNYYVRAEGTCDTTFCETITINVGVSSSPPDSVQISNNNICPGDSVLLIQSGGSLGNGDTWVWYTGACGAVPVGVGDSLFVNPNSTETLYIRAIGTCGASACKDTTIIVQNGSIQASGVSASENNFCKGISSDLNVVGGSLSAGANWNWYENSCGGVSIGSGTSISVTPGYSTNYYVRAEGGNCGNTPCESIFINVFDAQAYFVPFDTVCGLTKPFLLTGGMPTGGSYSGTGVLNQLFHPATSGYGTHLIYYSYISDNGCTAIDSTNLTIVPSSITGHAEVNIKECNDGGVSILIEASGSLTGDYTMTWSTNEIANPLTNVPAGYYSVTIGDGSGCTYFIDSIEVTTTLLCVDIPNTFSPNEDLYNDTWNIDLSPYGGAKYVQVFSKWGQVVLSLGEIDDFIWDGKYKNRNLPAGTYYYSMELNNPDYGKQTGPITIVR
mgnify:CR=1 FL=1